MRDFDYREDCGCDGCFAIRRGKDALARAGAGFGEAVKDVWMPDIAVDAIRADELGPKEPKTDSQKRKATPIFSGVMRYFPDALAAVSRLSKAGNDKHNPGEPLHWAREKSTDHGDCIARHQITFDQIDEETGEYHAVAVAWRALAQLQLLEEAKKCAAAQPVEPEWQVWLPSFMLPPEGRVDVKCRNGFVFRGFAYECAWGECDGYTITHWRRAA